MVTPIVLPIIPADVYTHTSTYTINTYIAIYIYTSLCLMHNFIVHLHPIVCLYYTPPCPLLCPCYYANSNIIVTLLLVYLMIFSFPFSQNVTTATIFYLNESPKMLNLNISNKILNATCFFPVALFTRVKILSLFLSAN